MRIFVLLADLSMLIFLAYVWSSEDTLGEAGRIALLTYLALLLLNVWMLI